MASIHLSRSLDGLAIFKYAHIAILCKKCALEHAAKTQAEATADTLRCDGCGHTLRVGDSAGQFSTR